MGRQPATLVPVQERTRPGNLEALALVSVLLLAGFTAYGSMDLLLWDETSYLARGIDADAFAAGGWEDSLSYAAMYSLLSLVVTDPVSLYLVGRTLSSVLIVLGVYVAARLNVAAFPALVSAGVMAALPLTYVWPGVAGPAAALLLVSAGLIWRNAQPWTLGLVTIFLWVAAASRPEFTWVAIASSIWVLAWQVTRWRDSVTRKITWRAALSVLGGLGVPILVIASFGNILASSPRQWTAFTQHFSLRNAAFGEDVWANADAVARTTFPTSGSVLQAMSENPGAVTEHVANNILWVPVTLAGHVLGLGGEAILRPISMAVALLFIGGLVLAGYRNRRHLRSIAESGVHTRLPAIVLAALLIVAFAIPALVIYPRPHYLLLPTMIGLLLAAIFLESLPDKGLQVLIPGATTAIGLLLLTLVSTQSVVARAANTPAWEASIRALQELPEGVRIVSVDERVCIYVENCVALPTPDASETAMTFNQYLDANRVNAVLAVPILADSAWGELRGVDEFLSNPHRFGFSAPVPDGPITIRQ